MSSLYVRFFPQDVRNCENEEKEKRDEPVPEFRSSELHGKKEERSIYIFGADKGLWKNKQREHLSACDFQTRL